ncbi:heme exporter protein CcmD [Marinovum sp. 2_MG-2023]|nr:MULTISPECIES: heme exporter protein CcmD [unclassified Marinovum]MDO6731060.1 heme exporter protein CcmD [Marinovum sp. 2_MG-2023]MDO6778557.1 heme exporter protein CcmD [Marinovum sp. 1_MG-2023]
MMIDLGKYAVPVLSAYAVSLTLLGLVIWTSLRRARRVRAQLDAVESRVRSQRSQ